MAPPAPRSNVIVTPEAVGLTLDVAGLGSRGIALLIDTAIQAGLGLVLFVAILPTNAIHTTSRVVAFTRRRSEGRPNMRPYAGCVR